MIADIYGRTLGRNAGFIFGIRLSRRARNDERPKLSRFDENGGANPSEQEEKSGKYGVIK